ncbi:hypothetical protein [Hugenholtzia roseola]|uniref:hypothetical protein n=1 Tax=Hugenholtzia roseola TaxID=1002 RepID=UPI0004164CF6|nr:hypothetical protein [Hugenholtzia roseola]
MKQKTNWVEISHFLAVISNVEDKNTAFGYKSAFLYLLSHFLPRKILENLLPTKKNRNSIW